MEFACDLSIFFEALYAQRQDTLVRDLKIQQFQKN